MINPKIVVDEETKKELDEIKIHPRETYGDIIKRLLQKYENKKEIEKNIRDEKDN